VTIIVPIFFVVDYKFTWPLIVLNYEHASHSIIYDAGSSDYLLHLIICDAWEPLGKQFGVVELRL